MNDDHSRNKSLYLERCLTALLVRAAKTYRIIVLTGARQVGKSTFLKNAPFIKKWEYLTLDDFDNLEAAVNSPDDLLAGRKKLIIDEVQKAPKLLSSIKKEADARPGEKRFILSGSANLLLMHKVSESLAGRAVYYVMRPFTLGETQGRKPSSLLDSLFSGSIPKIPRARPFADKLGSIILRGFLPPAVVQFKDFTSVLGWLEGYVATFLERDLRQLAQIDNLPDFRRLMEILALRSGQMLNQSEVSRDAKMPQPTVHRYINLLETAFLLERLPVYAVNRTKRLIKTPKLYWLDCGLAAFLMGQHSLKDLNKTREWGALFETLVFQHLKVWASLHVPAPRIYYWRTTAGQEIDFVIEHGAKLMAIEVKAAAEAKYSDTVNLRMFLENYPNTRAGILVYSGKAVKQMGKNLWAVPWDLLA